MNRTRLHRLISDNTDGNDAWRGLGKAIMRIAAQGLQVLICRAKRKKQCRERAARQGDVRGRLE